MRETDNSLLHDDLRPARVAPLGAPEVSVIVPVYNKAPFLAESLESILSQSLPSIEVICVDDASTDDSGRILEQFAERDARVSVICHECNRGAAAARNTGLAAARGEFVQFTDADDVLTPDGLRLLLDKAREDGVDVVRGGAIGFHSHAPGVTELLVSPLERSRFRPLEHRAFWVPWWHQTYLFSRRFLLSEQIHYPELCSGEDPVFLARVLTRVPYISTVSGVIYRYRLVPLEQKGRSTYQHLRDYLQHAEQVRSLYLDAHPQAWQSGFAPFVLPEVEAMLNNWSISHSERQSAAAEMQRIFELPEAASKGRARRKLLFMYNVCGLGGVETSIINKMEALRSRGVEVRALFQSLWGEGGKYAAQQPGFVVQADTETQQRFIREWNPDAIIVVDAPWLIDVAGMAGTDCPILFESHLSERAALEWRVRGGISDLRVSAILVPSDFNRRFLVEFGADPERMHVIPNPLDPARFRVLPDTDILGSLGIPGERRLVLFIGRLEPAKNALEFIQVCTLLARQDPHIHCVVVGDAVDTQDYAASVRAAASRAGLEVAFLEHIAYDDMPLLYNAVAASGGCLLSTSLNESQPMIVLEAMACGCPVVASDVGGLRDMIEDGRSGFLYPPGDVQEAATAVSKMINDGSRREAVVRAAADYVQTAHGLDVTAAAYLAVLDELAPAAAVSETARQAEATEGVAAAPGNDTAGVRLADMLGGLFSERLLAGVRQVVEPYRNVSPRVHLGFEDSATVTLEMRPKEDFSRSPDRCLNTVVLDYSGTSRWFTIEAPVSRDELRGAGRYQVGLHGRPSRELHCRVVLRVPQADGTSVDLRCCDLVLAPEGRPAYGRGQLRQLDLENMDHERHPEMLFFFDTNADLHLELDYMTAYFA